MGRIVKSGWILTVALSLAGGCAEEKKVPSESAQVDAGEIDAGVEQQDARVDCTPLPDHLTIINAPSTAEKVSKSPDLPLLNQDGTLPPLP